MYFPEYAHELAESASFAALPEALRHDITRELHERMGKHLPEITEDSMPGELANCIAGRIANIYQLSRSQLRLRRGVRLGDGGDQFGDPRD